MSELTHKNHFKFGYKDDKWYAKYGRCEREPYDFRRECVETAKLIGRSTDLPIYVLLSGGVDSEVVARSFMEAKVPFSCVIAKYNNDINKYDIDYAFDFVKKYNIPYYIFHLDVVDFWEEYLDTYALKTDCTSPQLPVIMWLSDQVVGYIIIGSGECYMFKNEHDEFELWEKEKIASWYRHYINTNKHGAPGFFQYTPELMLSFINDPIIQKTTDVSTYYVKSKVCYKHWPDIVERTIYTGFEKLEDLDYQKYRARLENKLTKGKSIIKTNINDLRNNLSPIKCKEITFDELMIYHRYYELENMTLKRSPFDDVVNDRHCFAAEVNNVYAGFTVFDVFTDLSKIYMHGAYTFKDFRNTGINNALWKYKIKIIKNNYADHTEIVCINPDWIRDAKNQEEMLYRKGFKHTSNRPDGAAVLTARLGNLK